MGASGAVPRGGGALAALVLALACGTGNAGRVRATYERDLERGEVALRMGQPDDAADAYRAALALRPADPKALHGLARARLAAGDGEGALAALGRLETSDPERAEEAGEDLELALFLAARSRLHRKDSSGALRLCRRLQALDPRYPGLQMLTTEALLAEAGRLQVGGRPEEAAARLREAVGSDAADGDVAFALAVALIDRGRLDPAISVLSDAVARRPDDARLRELMDRALRARYPDGLPD